MYYFWATHIAQSLHTENLYHFCLNLADDLISGRVKEHCAPDFGCCIVVKKNLPSFLNISVKNDTVELSPKLIEQDIEFITFWLIWGVCGVNNLQANQWSSEFLLYASLDTKAASVMSACSELSQKEIMDIFKKGIELDNPERKTTYNRERFDIFKTKE